MKVPTIRGLIDRRVLAIFRVAPDALRQILPAPFRPQLVDGFGIAGICLIRLKHARPKGSPSLVGISSENAAHRIAVEWDAGGKIRCGVVSITIRTKGYRALCPASKRTQTVRLSVSHSAAARLN